MPLSITTNSSIGLTLTNAGDNPVYITHGVTIAIAAGAAVVNGAALFWSVTNGVTAQIAGDTFGISLSGAGTVANLGTITASYTSGSGYSYSSTTKAFLIGSAGLYVGGGGISNLSSGVIRAPSIGAALGATGSVINEGSIGATGIGSDASFGVVLAEGGSVTNITGGQITSEYFGVFTDGAASVTNQSGATITGGARGILMVNGAASLSNLGGISGAHIGADLADGGTAGNANGAAITGGAYGVRFQNAGTLTNQGTVAGYSSVGAYLGAGGSLSNLSGGLISGGFDGVYVEDRLSVGSLGTVTNQGTINGTSFAGILLKTGGNVSNLTGGGITGSIEGILVETGPGTVTNQGVIRQPTPYSGQTYAIGGVLLLRGGSVNNEGGTITGSAYGVDVANATGTVTNSGVIASLRTAGGVGVLLYGGGSLSNAAHSSITSNFNGVEIQGTAGLVNNSGFIASYGVGYGAGAALPAGGSLTNASTGEITSDSYGVQVKGAAGTVNNGGSIVSNLTGAGAGIQLAVGGSVTNSQGGLIAGKWIGVQLGHFDGTSAPQGALGTLTFVNQGSVIAADGKGDGAAVWMYGPGTIINDRTGVIGGATNGKIVGDGTFNGFTNGGFGIVAYYQTTVINYGSIGGVTYNTAAYHNTLNGRKVGPAQFAFDAANTTPTNTVSNLIEIAPGSSFGGVVKGTDGTGFATLELLSGTSVGSVASFGKVTVSGVYYDGYLGFNAVKIDNGARWTLGGTVASGTTISFSAGGSSSLTFVNPSQVQGTITGLAAGDTVGLDGITVTGSSYAGGVLTLNEASGAITLNTPGTFTTGQFAVTNVPGAGAEISVQARTLVWTGGSSTNFGAAANWNDTTNNQNPATVAPNQTDVVSFVSGGRLIAGAGTVASMDFGGGAWQVGSSATIGAMNAITVGDSQASALLINGGAVISDGGTATIASQSSASGSSVNVVGSGSNWQVSGSLIVGSSATGSLDIAAAGSVAAASIDTGAAAAGAGIITVSGTSTSLSTTGSLIVGDLGTGELSVLSGAQLSAANITIGAQTGSTGNVDVEGNATQLTVSGTVTIGGLGSGVFTLGSGTTLTTGGGVFTTINGVFNQSGEVDPPHVVNDGQTNLSKGARTLADISIENSNEYTLQNGAATMYTPLITFDANPATDQGSTQGTWLISNAGTLVLNADTVDASQTIDFSATNAVLEIGQHPSMANGTITGTVAAGAANVLPGFGAPIENYRSGDKITFPGLTFGSDTVSGNVVTLWSGLAGTGTQLGSLDFITPSGAPDSAGALLADTQIATLACFAEGTRVRTVAGLVRVEALSVGDRVVTQDGVEQPVVWIGSRTVDCARHTAPETVWPVRVEAGAFGDNVPVRDLWLSPDHAVFVDGVLVPVKLLINGGTIEQVKRRTVTYYHVELPAHDVILAEDLPVESYLDTGDRGNFEDEHVVRLFPDFIARTWEMQGCAPLVMTGPVLERISGRLAHRQPVVTDAASPVAPTKRPPSPRLTNRQTCY